MTEWWFWKKTATLFDNDNRDSQSYALELVKTKIAALGLLATVIAGVALSLNYCTAQKDQKIKEEQLITDRFYKAVEQLGKKDEPTVRIGAIYALERIAKDSSEDYWTIMEVLTSYVREKSPWTDRDTEPEKISIDVQAALTVIGRRDNKKDPKDKHLYLIGSNIKNAVLWGANLAEAYLWDANLAEADLAGANLAGANLAGANLAGAKLEAANLEGAKLEAANLKGAKLEGAKFVGANLSKADLTFANLSKADLNEANLKGAKLEAANLEGAKLEAANLEGANLTLADLTFANLTLADLNEAKLCKAINLSTDKVQSAKNWDKAIYDEGWRKKLKLPPTKNKCE